jgi:hypothetical protein
MFNPIPAAYTWSDANAAPRPTGQSGSARGRIAVRILRPGTPAARIAKKVKAYFSKREDAYIMRPGQFRRFQWEYARVCKHPPARVYAWLAFDDTLCAGCCDCGTVLKGGMVTTPPRGAKSPL